MTMRLNSIAKPVPGEYAPDYERYISMVAGDDAMKALRSQVTQTCAWFAGLPPEAAGHRYEPGKWSVREVLGHMIDSERIFAYRALRFSRNDKSSLPGFEQEDFTRESSYEQCSLADLIEEFAGVRATTLCLYRNMSEDMLQRTGLGDNKVMSTRATGWIIAGHELHHMAILRDRYQVKRSV